MSSHRHEPIFDVHPVTGVGVRVFYADNRLVTFGTGGSGWFLWFRQRGFAPDGAAHGPFPHELLSLSEHALACQKEHNSKVNTDILRTRRNGLGASYS
jgi:hypothetical protein